MWRLFEAGGPKWKPWSHAEAKGLRDFPNMCVSVCVFGSVYLVGAFETKFGTDSCASG